MPSPNRPAPSPCRRAMPARGPADPPRSRLPELIPCQPTPAHPCPTTPPAPCPTGSTRDHPCHACARPCQSNPQPTGPTSPIPTLPDDPTRNIPSPPPGPHPTTHPSPTPLPLPHRQALARQPGPVPARQALAHPSRALPDEPTLPAADPQPGRQAHPPPIPERPSPCRLSRFEPDPVPTYPAWPSHHDIPSTSPLYPSPDRTGPLRLPGPSTTPRRHATTRPDKPAPEQPPHLPAPTSHPMPDRAADCPTFARLAPRRLAIPCRRHAVPAPPDKPTQDNPIRLRPRLSRAPLSRSIPTGPAVPVSPRPDYP